MQLQQETIQLCTPFMQDVLMVQTGRVFPTFQKEIYSLSLCVFWGGGGGGGVNGGCVGRVCWGKFQFSTSCGSSLAFDIS